MAEEQEVAVRFPPAWESVSQTRLALAVAREQFLNPEEEERLPLETVTRKLVKAY
jgi:hypothetical protein